MSIATKQLRLSKPLLLYRNIYQKYQTSQSLVTSKIVRMMDIGILRGPEIVKKYEIPDYSLGNCFFQAFKRHGNVTALVHGKTNREVTFDAILKKSTVLAKKLKDIGIGEGDVVSIVSENNLNYLIPVFSTWYLGATIAPINATLSIREIMHVLGLYKPKLIFCSSITFDLMRKIQKDVHYVKKFIIFDARNTETVDGFEDFEDLVCSDEKNDDIDGFEPVRVDPENQLAIILCSSGTTGLPKGVQLTHKNIGAALNFLSLPSLGNLTEGCVTIGILPFFHTFGFCTIVAALLKGVKTIVLGKFEPEVFLSSISTYGITNMSLVPPLLVFLAKSPLVEKYDLSSVKDILFGAAPASPEIIDLVKQRLNVENLRAVYGMTETTFAVTCTPMNRFKYGTSGMLAPGNNLKVIKPETNIVLGPNQKGEICISGQGTMKGYIGAIAETKSVLDDEGWIHTGDIGYYDSDGFVFIVDRIKELIKYKGYQVAPAEVEDLLLTHSKIKDCAVLGIPDENAGELPFAFVVKQPNVTLTEDDVIRYVNENASISKRLHGGMKFVDEIPKNPSGKILRRKLKDMYLANFIV